MPLDYKKIREINKGLYGTEVANYGKLFFKDMYADRTHFIFEMLQNAEDAIARRGKRWNGSRRVSFILDPEQLRIEHFGDPFSEDDVKGICSINRSTKSDSLTDIGRFGIGFKSVYAFTNRPEIHSGDEHFAIENYVWPFGIDPSNDENSEATRFILPFNTDDQTAHPDIERGLSRLGADTLLFLKQITEIEWKSASGRNGHYLREAKRLDEGVQHLIVIAEENGNEDIHMEWLVFSETVNDANGETVGQVDIAFSLEPESDDFQIEENSRLFVYFPTQMETKFGIRVNGPYRTTINRENVPPHDSWNKGLVGETAALLEKSLLWLRDHNRLDVATLRCLPLSRISLNSFDDEDDLLDPLFSRVKHALSSESLIPRLGGGYVSTDKALIGRTAGIRNLLTAEQISAIYGSDELSWLSNEISQDRTLSTFLIEQLEVDEVRPADVIKRLSGPFLEKQSDNWIEGLYEFLLGQSALADLYGPLPLVRLQCGSHVKAMISGKPKAYLPTENTTGFATVAASVCSTPEARMFLKSLGLSEPDLVDDVLKNVLPKYRVHDIDVGDVEYDEDIRRIVRAFENSEGQQKGRLISNLKDSNFIRLTDAAGHDAQIWGSPEEAYFPTENLRQLFEGVSGVRFVDTSSDWMNDEDFKLMLRFCGTASHLSTLTIENISRFTPCELKDMRMKASDKDGSSRGEEVIDIDIKGLSLLLNQLPKLDAPARTKRSQLLWKELRRVNQSKFSGRYSWFFQNERCAQFDAKFVEDLRRTPWVPGANGKLECPEYVVFDDLGWEEHSFLQSKIPFKPSTLSALAEQAGVEIEVLDELKRRGIATVTDFLEAVGDTESEEQQLAADAGEEENANAIGVGQEGISVRALQDAMTPNPPEGPTNPFMPPAGGPNTDESVASDSRKSALEGREGRRVSEHVTRFKLSDTAQELEQNFKSQLQGDYGGRCQICGAAFLTRGRQFQMFADHIVAPAKNLHTNHPGNLLSLCGWHYALVSHGQWVLLDSQDGDPIEGSEEEILLEQILEAPEKYDDDGNVYMSVPIRFWNVYPEWRPGPEAIDEEIRFSIPHWKYLCELLKA